MLRLLLSVDMVSSTPFRAAFAVVTPIELE